MDNFKYFLDLFIKEEDHNEFKTHFGDLFLESVKIEKQGMDLISRIYTNYSTVQEIQRFIKVLSNNKYYKEKDFSNLFSDDDTYYRILSASVALTNQEIYQLCNKKPIGYLFDVNDTQTNKEYINAIKLKILVQSIFSERFIQGFECGACNTPYPNFLGSLNYDSAIVIKAACKIKCDKCGGENVLVQSSSDRFIQRVQDLDKTLQSFLGRTRKIFEVEDLLI